MNMLKKFARIAVAVVLATGIAAGTAAPSEAAHGKLPKGGVVTFDTGWG